QGSFHQLCLCRIPYVFPSNLTQDTSTVYNLPIIVALPVGMFKKIKAEWFAVNQSKILTNFASRVKNFHNVDLWGVFRIERGELREIGWSESDR
ncbi:MAG: hypothetical protein ACFFCW_33520, partial [Candidatus Hodarchaeota archaeon]